MKPFSAPTRIGNYFEDLQLDESRVKEYLDRKARDELNITKMDKKLSVALKPVPLDSTAFVTFGANLMLFSHGSNSSLTTNIDINVGHEDLDLFQVSGSQDNNPYARSVFRIARAPEDADNDGPADGVLRYGQKIRICTHPDLGRPLYLWSTIKNQLHVSKVSSNQLVAATFKPEWRCVWQVWPVRPTDRVPLEGEPVPVGAPVIITHSQSGQSLYSDPKRLFRTIIGVEFEVIATVQKTEHNAEKPEHHFSFQC